MGRPYREGATLWYPLDDFRAFKEYRRRGEMTTLQYVRSIAHPQSFSVASVSDPGPLLLALKPRVRGLWRRIRRRRGLGRGEKRSVATASVQAAADVERTPAGTRS